MWIFLAIRYFAYNRGRSRSVGIFRLCSGLPRNRGSISSKDKRLLLVFPKRPGQFCTPNTLLSMGCQVVYFPGLRQSGSEADISSASSAKAQTAKSGVSPPSYASVAWCLIEHRNSGIGHSCFTKSGWDIMPYPEEWGAACPSVRKFTVLLWRWMRKLSPKRRELPTRIHCVVIRRSQHTATLIQGR